MAGGTGTATLSLLLVAICATVAAGQSDRLPQDGGTTYALGMPPIWKGHAGASFGWYRPKEVDELTVLAHAGVSRDLLSPIAGIARVGVEGYGGYRGSTDLDGGGRALFGIPSLHVAAGADYNVSDHDWSALFRLEIPFRRSGIFGRGTQVRFEWLPNRGHTFSVGLTAPLWGRNIGKTRPQRDSYELESPPIQRVSYGEDLSGSLEEAVEGARQGARWIAVLSTPLLDHGGADATTAYAGEIDEIRTHMALRDARFPGGHTFQDEVRVFHEELARAFSVAVEGRSYGPGQSSPQGRQVAERARALLLDHVLLPYDALLGQRKAHDSLDEFAASAQAAFSRWLLPRTEIPEERFLPIVYVFQSLVDIAEEVRKLQLRRWEDSRFVWLPLQLALRAEDHDTQPELNALIEQATGGRFTTGNHIAYAMNEDFQIEFARSVGAAETYHVLWIHDYRGKNAQGKPDELGFRQTVEVYMATLTKRVRAYDETGQLPQYFIFLDQNYFEANDTRLYFRVLLDPMNADLSLPSGYEEWEQEFRRAQADLRAAVADSKVLQSERRQFGDRWLRNRIRVQVNITNPVDHSFLSTHVAGIFPVPDNVIRDHRKIAFYDITEADPYRGMAMYTGMGIGEHYAGRNWEDRAIIVRGPSALSVKNAARALLETQGFEPHEIPFPLRAEEEAHDYHVRTDSVVGDMTSRLPRHEGQALELHNQTGYGPKPIDVKKGILYSLMPAGSQLKVPDSLWQSYIYASLLAGSALRGCKVMIVAPSLASAPSSAPPTMARAHGLLSGLVAVQNGLREEIESAGGLLKTGLYAPQVGVGDLAGRIRQALDLDLPWLRRIYPPNPAIRATADSLQRILQNAGYRPNYLVNSDSTESPKLHMKANFFITGEVMDSLMRLPEWGPVVREYIRYLALETGPRASRVSATDAPEPLRQATLELARALQRTYPADRVDQAFAYFTVGSTNLNYRSMVLDGEVEITVTGWDTLPGLVDFLLVFGLTEWVEDQEHLDALLPPPSGMTRRVANLIRLLL